MGWRGIWTKGTKDEEGRSVCHTDLSNLSASKLDQREEDKMWG